MFHALLSGFDLDSGWTSEWYFVGWICQRDPVLKSGETGILLLLAGLDWKPLAKSLSSSFFYLGHLLTGCERNEIDVLISSSHPIIGKPCVKQSSALWSEASCALKASQLVPLLYVGLSATDPPSAARLEAAQLPMGFKAQCGCHSSLFILAAWWLLELF